MDGGIGLPRRDGWRRSNTWRRTECCPAIYFIFSRAGCDAAALRVLESGIRLNSPDERERIRAIAEERTAHLSEADLASSTIPAGFHNWKQGPPLITPASSPRSKRPSSSFSPEGC